MDKENRQNQHGKNQPGQNQQGKNQQGQRENFDKNRNLGQEHDKCNPHKKGF